MANTIKSLTRATAISNWLFRVLILGLILGPGSWAAWTNVIKFKVGVIGRTPDEIERRFGEPHFDTRDYVVGSQPIFLVYRTPLGLNWAIRIDGGKAISVKYESDR